MRSILFVLLAENMYISYRSHERAAGNQRSFGEDNMSLLYRHSNETSLSRVKT